jgi:glyoxylase-like metal-dependent hydrolase (beta-lactamase superfamily II)
LVSVSTTGLKPLTAQEVYEKILEKEKLFILDVRNEDAYADWKIEGETVVSVNIPYFEMLDGVEAAMEKLPQDQPVLVVCAKVGSSEFVAQQLIEAGRKDVYFLQGGMKTWSEYLHPVKVGGLKNGGVLYQLVRVGKGCLSYMIISNGEAAAIDAVRILEPFEQLAKKNNAKIKYIIDTHLHADHISGGRKLAEKTGATYWLPPKDAAEVTFSYQPLEESRDLVVGDTTVKIHPVYSPGHTIGSTSLIVDDQYLLSGDILFVESIGRPDLAGKAEDWVGDLRHTLYQTYKQLPQDLVVLPAHFGRYTELDAQGKVSAKLGDLYKVNEGLKVEDEQTFRRIVTENLPPQPNSYQEIRHTNMGKINPNEDEQREMEIGPNRCAVHG